MKNNKLKNEIATKTENREKAFHNNYFSSKEIRKKENRLYTTKLSQTLFGCAFSFIKPSDNAVVLHIGSGSNISINNRFKNYGFDKIYCIDLSYEAIKKSRKGLFKKKDSSWKYVSVMNANKLGFKENKFDIVFGRAIVHHLDIKPFAFEIQRVLKDSGIAVFIEPLGYNPIINLYRKLTPQSRTIDEHPLLMENINYFREVIGPITLKYFFLTQLLPIMLFSNFKKIYEATFIVFGYIDKVLFRILPSIRKYSWSVVFAIKKDAS